MTKHTTSIPTGPEDDLQGFAYNRQLADAIATGYLTAGMLLYRNGDYASASQYLGIATGIIMAS